MIFLFDEFDLLTIDRYLIWKFKTGVAVSLSVLLNFLCTVFHYFRFSVEYKWNKFWRKINVRTNVVKSVFKEVIITNASFDWFHENAIKPAVIPYLSPVMKHSRTWSRMLADDVSFGVLVNVTIRQLWQVCLLFLSRSWVAIVLVEEVLLPSKSSVTS